MRGWSCFAAFVTVRDQAAVRSAGLTGGRPIPRKWLLGVPSRPVGGRRHCMCISAGSSGRTSNTRVGSSVAQVGLEGGGCEDSKGSC